MENKKDKVALNDELLEKAAGGVPNIVSDDYLPYIEGPSSDSPESVQVFWFGCNRCHNEFRSYEDYVCVSPCCGGECYYCRATIEYI